MNKEEMMKMLKASGLEPQRLVAVPYFEDVSAGIPKEPGDYDGEVMMVPEDWLEDGPIAQMKVKGDSMKDAGIENGDVVTVLWGQEYEDGDIVVAVLERESTVKAFFRDKHGHAWLVPMNDDYDPVDIEKYTHACVLGRATKVTKSLKRVSYRYMQERIDAALIATENPVDTSVLESPDALACWAALREAGVVDERNRAKVEWQNAAIADVMGDYLAIRNKWEVFAAFYKKKNKESFRNNLSSKKEKDEKTVKIFIKTIKSLIQCKR
ncbi:MAG: hypothetical protein IJ901_10970 [Bacteroidaceae bacterium]|nr:hypothetical protein [Bacteroidaceae bacterium]